MAKKIAFKKKISLWENIKGHIVKYKNFLFLSFILLSGLGIWTGRYLKKKYGEERREVVEALAEIQYCVEKKEYDKALEGRVGIYPGLESLSDRFIRDKALRNLVNLYTAIVYKERKDYEKSLIYLQRVQIADCFMQARIKCLEGDMHSELANYNQALACYLEASKLTPNEFFTPTYLMRASGVYEKQKAYDKAMACYQMIIDKYPTCRQRIEVEKHLARLRCLKLHSKDL